MKLVIIHLQNLFEKKYICTLHYKYNYKKKHYSYILNLLWIRTMHFFLCFPANEVVFHDMLIYAIVGIHVFKKKGGVLLLLVQLVLLIIVYFILFERNNRVFYQIYQFHPDVYEEIFELVQSRLIELEPRYQIAAALKSIWRLLMSWGFIASASYWFYFFCRNQLTSYVILINRSTIF